MPSFASSAAERESVGSPRDTPEVEGVRLSYLETRASGRDAVVALDVSVAGSTSRSPKVPSKVARVRRAGVDEGLKVVMGKLGKVRRLVVDAASDVELFAGSVDFGVVESSGTSVVVVVVVVGRDGGPSTNVVVGASTKASLRLTVMALSSLAAGAIRAPNGIPKSNDRVGPAETGVPELGLGGVWLDPAILVVALPGKGANDTGVGTVAASNGSVSARSFWKVDAVETSGRSKKATLVGRPAAEGDPGTSEAPGAISKKDVARVASFGSKTPLSDRVGAWAKKVPATSGSNPKVEEGAATATDGVDGAADGTKVVTAGWVRKRVGRRRTVGNGEKLVNATVVGESADAGEDGAFRPAPPVTAARAASKSKSVLDGEIAFGCGIAIGTTAARLETNPSFVMVVVVVGGCGGGTLVDGRTRRTPLVDGLVATTGLVTSKVRTGNETLVTGGDVALKKWSLPSPEASVAPKAGTVAEAPNERPSSGRRVTFLPRRASSAGLGRYSSSLLAYRVTAWLQSTLYHQSQPRIFWLNTVMLGHRKLCLMRNVSHQCQPWHRVSGSA